MLPELRRSIVEIECDPNEGLKFDDDGEDDDEVRGGRRTPGASTRTVDLLELAKCCAMEHTWLPTDMPKAKLGGREFSAPEVALSSF